MPNIGAFQGVRAGDQRGQPRLVADKQELRLEAAHDRVGGAVDDRLRPAVAAHGVDRKDRFRVMLLFSQTAQLPSRAGEYGRRRRHATQDLIILPPSR